MPNRTSKTGSELFIVDNSDADWKVLRYLHDWCQISKAIDIATGYFEIGALLGLKDEWQRVDHIRILMGDEVSKRTKAAFREGLANIKARLDASLETEKIKNDFLSGVPAIVEAIQSGKILCRVYRKAKFHAKAYITHARLEVVGASALVGSSNFTLPGLTENIELNVQITGRPVSVLQEWYEEHWNAAEDVTPEILRTIERHIRDYSPFEVYANALHELHHREPMSDQEWFTEKSCVYPVLDQYQRDGFHRLLEIANVHGGGFLCDGVGLGKTFIGLMLIEYLITQKRKRVALLVPKAGREPVWEIAIRRYLPHLAGGTFSSLEVLNHTDLQRAGDFPLKLERVKEMADVILIDEAHHFRNPGFVGTGRGQFQPTKERAPSRYRRLFDMIESPHGNKQVFMLTATPINNKLIDLQHMIELFSRRKQNYFARLGIHSLPGHFKKMEKDLEKATVAQANNGEMQTDLFEAEEVLTGDLLFRELVVQRSRAYVKESQIQQGSSVAAFPTRDDPRVADYKLKNIYGKLLDKLDQAFAREKPLFSLAIYYPLHYYRGDDKTIDPVAENRQKQVVALIRTNFLKRFESSTRAFECSCDRLLLKLLTFATKHSESEAEKTRLFRWKTRHKDLIGYVQDRYVDLFGESEEEPDEDLVSDEMLQEAEYLRHEDYDVVEILQETYSDLDQVAEFLDELRKFKTTNDDKLKALIDLLKKDTLLKGHKVLIFSEFSDTARYLKAELVKAGIDGVEEIDSGTHTGSGRSEVIRRFAPYYNGSSSAELAQKSQSEIRILISTDVLSEGLNLQDACRLINYDLHWNPVRLMQRIGRVDRRMNPEIEARLIADHPEVQPIRGRVAYWNFLPPDELDDLLSLYNRVTHKTLRISKTFGIEGQKLLRPEDEFEALKNFNHRYEGVPTPAERMDLEYQKLLKDHPELAAALPHMPGRVFSGKKYPTLGARAVFFCFALPAADHSATPDDAGALPWTEEAGRAAWYLYDLETGNIDEEPTRIIDKIRCEPDTPRHCTIAKPTLSEIRAKVEQHIRNTYLKSVQAPQGVKPSLKAWMELS
jgi:superfamily II DNA or RNA helicase